jgi:ABC-type uncharacterized transport system substrate-binding protein
LAVDRATLSNLHSRFFGRFAAEGSEENRDVIIQYSSANGHYDLLPTKATELVRRCVAVIVTFAGTVTAEAARAATSNIPIVFALGTDPVSSSGLVTSLNRPRGNLTGATSLNVGLSPKRLELLHDLASGIARIAFLINPTNPADEITVKEVEEAAAALGKQAYALPLSNDSDFGGALDRLTQVGAQALLATNEPYHLSRRERVVALAAQRRIPAIYGTRDYVTAGGLMSYGAAPKTVFAVAGGYAGRILKGEKPPDLPVVQPAIFELIINLATAKALGLDFPPIIAARATEVIE